MTITPTKAILFFVGCSEVISTWLITSELANQRGQKVLFTCVVYTNSLYSVFNFTFRNWTPHHHSKPDFICVYFCTLWLTNREGNRHWLRGGEWFFKNYGSCKIFVKFHRSYFLAVIWVLLSFFQKAVRTNLDFPKAKKVSKCGLLFSKWCLNIWEHELNVNVSSLHLKHFEVLVSCSQRKTLVSPSCKVSVTLKNPFLTGPKYYCLGASHVAKSQLV